MSEAPNRAHESRLPPELLLQIFDHVTFYSGEGGISDWAGKCNPLEIGRVDFSQMYQSRRGSDGTMGTLDLHNRIVLTMVCRRWRSIALEILYRSVKLRNLFQLGAFTQVLDSNLDYGRLVKTLDIHVKAPVRRNQRTLLYDHLGTVVPQVFRACPNLVAFMSQSRKVDLSGGTVDQQTIPSHDRFRYMDSSHIFTQSPRYQTTALEFTSNYQNLRFFFLSTQFLAPSPDTPPLSLPSLEILSIDQLYLAEIDEYLSKSYLPRLHSLHAPSFTAAEHLFERFPKFLACHGRKILTLKVTSEWYIRDLPYFHSPGLSNLQRLILYPLSNLNPLEVLSKQNAIRVLEILIVDKQTKETLENTRFFHSDIMALFPHLRLLRFSTLPDASGEMFHKEGVVELIEDYISRTQMVFEARGVEIQCNIKAF